MWRSCGFHKYVITYYEYNTKKSAKPRNNGDFYQYNTYFTSKLGFKTRNFKKLLLSVQAESMENQKKLIDEAFDKWRGGREQIDDICVMGIRL